MAGEAMEALKARLAEAQAKKTAEEAAKAAYSERQAQAETLSEAAKVQTDAKLREVLPGAISGMRAATADSKTNRDAHIASYKGSHQEVAGVAKGLKEIGDDSEEAKAMVDGARDEIRSGSKDTLIANQNAWKQNDATVKSLEELSGMIDQLTAEEKGVVLKAIETSEYTGIEGLAGEVKVREEKTKEAAAENLEQQKQKLETQHKDLVKKWEEHMGQFTKLYDQRKIFFDKLQPIVLQVLTDPHLKTPTERTDRAVLELNMDPRNVEMLNDLRKNNNGLLAENNSLVASTQEFNKDLRTYSHASGDTVQVGTKKGVDWDTFQEALVPDYKEGSFLTDNTIEVENNKVLSSMDNIALSHGTL